MQISKHNHWIITSLKLSGVNIIITMTFRQRSSQSHSQVLSLLITSCLVALVISAPSSEQDSCISELDLDDIGAYFRAILNNSDEMQRTFNLNVSIIIYGLLMLPQYYCLDGIPRMTNVTACIQCISHTAYNYHSHSIV